MSIDPDLRLRTVKTAHSVLAESIRSEALAEKREKRRRLFRSMKRKASGIGKGTLKRKSPAGDNGKPDSVETEGFNKDAISTGSLPSQPPPISSSEHHFEKTKGKAKNRKAEFPRRTVYVNIPLPSSLRNSQGEPVVRYVRNKVRTSKYSLITFIPKNLLEQFRRVANIYFLFLVILQLFSVFGAPNAQIGMLPLLAILGMTAIKDAFEDWRRAKLDNEVNNSATTKLGAWKNVNQPKDPRNFLEKVFGLGPNPNKTSKGVQKLRDREANVGNQMVLESRRAEEQDPLEDLAAGDKESYPLGPMRQVDFSTSLVDSTSDSLAPEGYDQSFSAAISRSSLPSMMSRKSVGVMDWSRSAPGAAQWERTLWKKLEVGDLVLLRDNEQVPADIIVLSTSNSDALCFVETKNLDGETNLKIRRSLKATSVITSEEDLEHARFVVDSEPPHANLYSYNGVLKYNPTDQFGKQTEEKQEAITINELLLRGCTLRNTKWVIGMVIFTGSDTKIMLNGGETPSKRSKIEKETSNNVMMNFVVLLLLCLITAILHGWYRSLSGTSADWYEPGAEASDNIYVDSVIIFFSCLLIFQNIVPISLYITVEIVKTIQAYFIFQDVEMYYEPYNTPCVPKTWNISDDLGQIEYVFSDKTGTLTQNIMEFKKCSIHGVPFGEGMTEAMMGARKRDGDDISAAMENQEEELQALKEKMLELMTGAMDNRYLRQDKLTLIAPDLVQRLVTPSDPLRSPIIDFFRALAVCHSVLADTPDPSKPFELEYKAESPDEAALVAAARDIGFPFVLKNSHSLEIEVLGNPEKWTPLRVLEFSSSRKRMSVVARNPNGKIVLFCKGADSVIYNRLNVNHDQELKDATLRDLETFANGGLRTLCIAYRDLSEEEFNDWSKKYDTASAATVDREGEIEKACDLVEHSLTILGATALEDKLQEGVPDAIATLHRAGIKLWILTGDKLQTAIEIGYSCNLLTNDMEVMIISADSEDGARQQIEAGLNKIASVVGPPPTTPGGKIMTAGMNPAAEFAVVIDGESLRYALQPALKSLFLSLGTQCAAVICCRVSPSQKASTVRLVKEGCNAMTLAIGDGANDVAMIQEANIGAGLYGLEGSQAAMSADYAFGQFRFLTRLLLVHGRWSYVRVADMHANFFYKNVIFTVSMFWFFIFSSFDATYLFEYTLLLMYNLFFTSLPVGFLGAFDQDVNATAAMVFPQLYKRGIAGLEYTRTRFWLYMFDGLYQSAVIFFIPYFAYGTGESWSSQGRDTNSLWDIGTTVACAGVLSANGYVSINIRYWTIMTWIVNVVSTLLIYIYIPIYSAVTALPYAGEVGVIYPTFSFWAIILLATVIAIGPRWLVRSFKQSYFPQDKDIIREAWVNGQLKRKLGIKSRKQRKRQKQEKAEAAKCEETEQRPANMPGLELGTGKDIVQQFQKVHMAGDAFRGLCDPTATYGPRKEAIRSSLMSEEGSPRGMRSYPPASTNYSTNNISSSRQIQTTDPPPLTIRTSFSSAGQQSSLGQSIASDDHDFRNPLRAFDSYPSPSSLHQVEAEISREVSRLKRTSMDIQRASLYDKEEEPMRMSRAPLFSPKGLEAFPRGGDSRGSISNLSEKQSISVMGGSAPAARKGSCLLSNVDELGRENFSPLRRTFDVDVEHSESLGNRVESQNRRPFDEPYTEERSSCVPQKEAFDFTDDSSNQWGKKVSKKDNEWECAGYAI
ncbi:uncharacterized protein IAS62_000253 [Cryptococcus decagattii]|uniref:Phospholipid-transporting ATPase n=1 Tax=Cryptococcus decagattii TaxID=1859122 RepID=A0ABZ2ANE0_9TREE